MKQDLTISQSFFFCFKGPLGILLTTLSSNTAYCFFNSIIAFSANASTSSSYFSYRTGTVCKTTKPVSPIHEKKFKLLSMCCYII
ncbi:hypothetical protein HanRHA438_Chr04g0192581 [Helianthus annuus]|nr:hypothetical protein HanRHA438_Chr04g0192581 [Helianthus annuus]